MKPVITLFLAVVHLPIFKLPGGYRVRARNKVIFGRRVSSIRVT